MLSEWYESWLDRLMAESQRSDWPHEPAYWDSIRRTLARTGATLGEATEALDAIGEAGWPYPSEFRERLTTALLEAQKRTRAALPSDAPLDRSEAERQSKGCHECAGGGITTRRFAHERYPGGVGISCYCHACAMGRWMKSAHEAANAKLSGAERRIALNDLRDRPDLWDWPHDQIAPPRERLRVVG